MKSSVVAPSWPKIERTQKTGKERFAVSDCPMNLSLFDFWNWSASDLVSNATRRPLEVLTGTGNFMASRRAR